MINREHGRIQKGRIGGLLLRRPLKLWQFGQMVPRFCTSTSSASWSASSHPGLSASGLYLETSEWLLVWRTIKNVQRVPRFWSVFISCSHLFCVLYFSYNMTIKCVVFSSWMYGYSLYKKRCALSFIVFFLLLVPLVFHLAQICVCLFFIFLCYWCKFISCMNLVLYATVKKELRVLCWIKHFVVWNSSFYSFSWLWCLICVNINIIKIHLVNNSKTFNYSFLFSLIIHCSR